MSESIRGRISGAGRVVLPAELRKAFHLQDGEEVLFSRTEYGIQVTPLRQAIRQAQETVCEYIPTNVNLVRELRDVRGQDKTLD